MTKIKCDKVLPVALAFGFSSVLFGAPGNVKGVEGVENGPKKIFAQKLVEDTAAAHAEIFGVELATTPPNNSRCVTIASTNVKAIGEKCDKDEYTPMRTDKPFVEKEREHGNYVFDVTIPIHDAEGKIIATAGMDFKPEPNQQEAIVLARAQQIAHELEQQITSKERLFEPVPTGK